MNPSEQIDKQISDLKDWRGELFTKLRKLINAADPSSTEEFKWGTAVWANNGMICAVGSFKDHLKINFFQGASLSDPNKLFNSGLEAKKTRAIDIFEKDKINENELKDMIQSAIEFNKNK